jgi:hypothetical protein
MSVNVLTCHSVSTQVEDKKKSSPATGLDSPLEFQEVEAPEFPDKSRE